MGDTREIYVDEGGRRSCKHSSIVPQSGLTHHEPQLAATTHSNSSLNNELLS
jgi:hypothetical protein